MFGKGKRSSPQPARPSVRDTLFGDLPMEQWPMGDAGAEHEPWKAFVLARKAMRENRPDEAIELWKRVAESAELESRHYLQAWHFLRQHGVQPDTQQAKTLLGVVLEVPMNGGLDLLAGYPEHTAR